MHIVPYPVSLLVAVRVVVVDVRVVYVAIDVDIVEHVVVVLVHAEPTDLIVLVGMSKWRSTVCEKAHLVLETVFFEMWYNLIVRMTWSYGYQ